MIGKMPMVILFGPMSVYDTIMLRAQQEITVSGAVTLVPDNMDDSIKMTNFINSADRIVKIEVDGIQDPVSDANDMIARKSGKVFEIWKYQREPVGHTKGGHRYVWRRVSVNKIT